MPLGIINWSQFCCSFTVFVVALEDATCTLTLASNNSTHVGLIIISIIRLYIINVIELNKGARMIVSNRTISCI